MEFISFKTFKPCIDPADLHHHHNHHHHLVSTPLGRGPLHDQANMLRQPAPSAVTIGAIVVLPSPMGLFPLRLALCAFGLSGFSES
jgi:hypothetical protein